MKEYLSSIEANPGITLDELAVLVDQRLETEERAMNKSNDIFETDKIFNNIRILGWINDSSKEWPSSPIIKVVEDKTAFLRY